MSLRGIREVVPKVNAGLRIYKFIGAVKPNSAGATLDASLHKDTSLLNQQLNKLSLYKKQVEKFNCAIPILDVAIKKNIIEPTKNVKIDFELPVRNSNITFMDLPLHTEKEIQEPGKVIEKKAIHMVTIRKRKMRKHKHKKYLKRCRIELEKKRLLKEIEEENKFQNSLRAILNEKDEFSAEKYVTDTLEKVNWVKPVTKARGRLAPQWVIKQELQRQRDEEVLRERIQDCLTHFPK